MSLGFEPGSWAKLIALPQPATPKGLFQQSPARARTGTVQFNPTVSASDDSEQLLTPLAHERTIVETTTTTTTQEGGETEDEGAHYDSGTERSVIHPPPLQ